KGPFAAALFFCGTLVPALGFVDVFPMTYSWVADHFQYLASIGPIVLLAALIVTLLPSGGPAKIAIRSVFSISLLALLGYLTWQQGRIYKDLETLWRDT